MIDIILTIIWAVAIVTAVINVMIAGRYLHKSKDVVTFNLCQDKIEKALRNSYIFNAIALISLMIKIIIDYMVG